MIPVTLFSRHTPRGRLAHRAPKRSPVTAVLPRSLCSTLALAAVLASGFLVFEARPAQPLHTTANVPVELAFAAQAEHPDPFNTVTMDVLFTDPAGVTRRVPGFWSGGRVWKARYASRLRGNHRWRSECATGKDAGLDGVEGTVEVAAYGGENPFFRHGPIQVADDRRHFEHADGTPFFWLGDTWWMGLCHRLHWPDEVKTLAADRRAKGFNVIQIVAGLYPDMPPFDPRGANEAGFPWQTNYASIRPEYFDAADQRLMYLVDTGFSPCIVGAWGYFIPWMGVEKAKQHWRYLIARYGAWPVTWCVAGEANLPYYLAKGFPFDDRKQVKDWTEVMRYVRQTDPFHRMISIHPTGMGALNARGATDDPSLLDYDMLQTPHGQREAVAPTLKAVRNSFATRPAMPVLNGEPCYEMLMDAIPPEWPRAMFWLCMMNGAAGHTYGANGIWQCNRRDQPHGPSPHGGSYGLISWDDAMRLPGSRQIGLGKAFMERFPWSRLEPHADWAVWAEAPRTPAWGAWIWFPEGDPKRDAPVAARCFRRTFELPAGKTVRQSSLSVCADDQFTVWIDNQRVGAGADWHSPNRFDVTALLMPGTHVLAVLARNSAAPVSLNPAGLLGVLEAEFADGALFTLRTDADWRSASEEAPGWREIAFDDAKWVSALVTAPYTEGPWGTLGNDASGFTPQVAGIPDRLRICYLLDRRAVLVRDLEAGSAHRLTRFDPATGKTEAAIVVHANAQGECRVEPPAAPHDWVFALEAQTGTK